MEPNFRAEKINQKLWKMIRLSVNYYTEALLRIIFWFFDVFRLLAEKIDQRKVKLLFPNFSGKLGNARRYARNCASNLNFYVFILKSGKKNKV